MFKLPNRVVQNWAQVQTNFLKLEEWLRKRLASIDGATLLCNNTVVNNSTTASDVPGCSVTLPPGLYVLSVGFDIFQANTGFHLYGLQIVGQAQFSMHWVGTLGRGYLSRTVVIELTAERQVKAIVERISGSGETTVYETHSYLSWARLK